MRNDLLPCPFCGGSVYMKYDPDAFGDNNGSWQLEHDDVTLGCHYIMYFCGSEWTATKQWNKRAEVAA